MTNRGMHEDCALLVELEIPSGVGIAHGWQPVQGSFKVTESDCNVIRTLDWEPAFSVYSKVLEEHAGIRMDRGILLRPGQGLPLWHHQTSTANMLCATPSTWVGTAR